MIILLQEADVPKNPVFELINVDDFGGKATTVSQMAVILKLSMLEVLRAS